MDSLRLIKSLFNFDSWFFLIIIIIDSLMILQMTQLGQSTIKSARLQVESTSLISKVGVCVSKPIVGAELHFSSKKAFEI